MTDSHLLENGIAIVGMALRVPGAATPEAYWRNLCDGVESLRAFSDEELLSRGVSPAQLSDPHYVKAGMPLDGFDQFDPEFFGFSPKEAAILDPQHRLFYEVAWEALERAGHPPARFSGSVGVFAGCGMNWYFARNILTNPDLVDSVGLFLLRHTGNDKDFLSTRVSYAFNLRGPSVNVQTACSTSLVATHLAVQSLLAGECDMALAGGSTLDLPQGVGYVHKEGEILSPDGHCRAFDHRSKGTVFGSGTGVVILRRLSDAIKDGDHVHAVIRGTAINNDGAGKAGYLAPSVNGQAAAITEALSIADVDAESIAYVECHGTGTPVGDPIEVTALSQAFRQTSNHKGNCLIGSVKSNIGHLDTAAGVVGLIKTALALEHRYVPPSLNFEAPNPVIPFEGSPFAVAASGTSLAGHSGPLRAAVNSLGVGGTNAFVVLEETPPSVADQPDSAPQLIVLSARNRKALDAAQSNLVGWLRNNPDQRLDDLSYTLLKGRHGFDHRRVLAASSPDELIQLLEENDPRRVFTHVKDLDRPSVVFMFPGGGAQYPGMALGLYRTEPVFRACIDDGLRILRDRFGHDLVDVFMDAEATQHDPARQLERPSIQLPLIFLVEYALTKLWAHYGMTPSALIGHSMGENTAACVAGVFSLEDALGLVLLRGQLMDEVERGGMLSVALPAGELAEHLGEHLDLASANSPGLSVASGPIELLDALQGRLVESGIECQRIKIDIAAHSRMLDPVLERFRSYLGRIRLNPPAIPIVSNRTGDWLEASAATSPEYWVQHLRGSVQFSAGVLSLLEDPDRVFLEVGPGNALSSLVRQHPGASNQRVVSSIRHPQDACPDQAYLRTMAGRLWAAGLEIRDQALWVHPRRRLILPTYPFQHGTFWIEPGRRQAVEATTHSPSKIEAVADWFRVPRWVQQGIVSPQQGPFRWLVFATDDEATNRLVSELERTGHSVVRVIAGDAFVRLDERTFTLAPEAGGPGYAQLFESLAAEDYRPDRILHTWLVTRDESHRPGSSFFHRSQEHGFYSLFHLARALGKVGFDEHRTHLIVAANGAQRVGPEALSFPEKATVLGVCGVLPREFPALSCTFVDLQDADEGVRRGWLRSRTPDANAELAYQQLATELTAEPRTEVVAWRGDTRWKRYASGQFKAPADAQPKLRQRGVYLITGGFGGIGSVVARWLAQDYAARLVLASRTPLPDRSQWAEWLVSHPPDDSISSAIRLVEALESLGAEVLPVAADVTVEDDMQELMRRVRDRFAVLNGVFHAAGVTRDSLIQLKSQREIEDVFAAKVYGTLVLDRVLGEEPLDFILLFSSTSAMLAPQGQVDYVGANSFLNAFAESCAGRRPYPVTAINWGIWRDVGIAARQVSDAAAVPFDASSAQVPSDSTRYPRFTGRTSARDGVEQVHVFEGSLHSGVWFIDEHRLATREAILPGTGFIELMRAALEEIGVSKGWSLRNLVFHAPIVVPQDQHRTFRVVVRGTARRVDLRLEARLPGSNQDRWQLCADASCSNTDSEVPQTLDIGPILQRCDVEEAAAGGSSTLRSSQEDHLHFGPRWRVLKRVYMGRGEAVAELELADEFVRDLATEALHPGLLDIATGFAMPLIEGFGGSASDDMLWVPLSYGTIAYHAPLVARCRAWARLNAGSSVRSGTASFDIVVLDQAGEVLLETKRLVFRLVPSGTIGVGASPNDVSVAPAGDADIQTTKVLSPGERALAHNRSQGILNEEGLCALRWVLSSAMPPEIIVSSLDIDQLDAQLTAVSASASTDQSAKFERPTLDTDFEAPCTPLEVDLAALWGRLLGIEGIGIHDSFFDLGGHSLIAVRLFNELSERYGLDLPMSALMQSPTIAKLAELVAPHAGDVGPSANDPSHAPEQALQLKHLVPMHAGPVANGTPFFVVAGMFGNVLNLGHLAHLIGEERPFYAIQAKGLYGGDAPHETFEEMARDYLAELRSVQPHGPYLLGGFSGGGIAAYEMARQLLADGELVDLLVLLDTPVPQFPVYGLADRIQIFYQGMRDGGIEFLTDKVQSRLRWEQERRAARSVGELHGRADDAAHHFQSQRIGDAFVRALKRYELRALPVRVALFRPRQQVAYRLSGGRQINRERYPVYPDNGWTPYVPELSVVEVPGNHDSMVLEPNVRVLASNIQKRLRAAAETGQ